MVEVLSRTLCDSNESQGEVLEKVFLCKPVEANGEGVSARAFTQSVGEPALHAR